MESLLSFSGKCFCSSFDSYIINDRIVAVLPALPSPTVISLAPLHGPSFDPAFIQGFLPDLSRFYTCDERCEVDVIMFPRRHTAATQVEHLKESQSQN